MNLSSNQQHFSATAPPVALHQTRVARTIELPQRFDVHADLDVQAMFSEAGTTLLIDGSNVAFADMSSLQSLVDARLTALGRDGDLVIALPSDELRATLELTGFDSLIPVFTGGAQ